MEGETTDPDEEQEGESHDPVEGVSIAGRLLVASARMMDPNFTGTVIYMLRHGPEGALGVVLNRATEVTLRRLGREVLGQEILREGMLYVGGPCEGPLMAVWRGWGDGSAALGDADVQGAEGGLADAGEPVEPGLRFAGDRNTLTRLLKGVEGDVRFFAGYSGWTAGQLERELGEGTWVVMGARQELVLGEPDRLWDRAVIEAVVGYPVKAEILPKDPSQN
jgi:putative transcriptional regulator